MEEQEIKKEETYISDISEEEENQEPEKPAKRIDFRFELALFLILGFLLGVVIKTEAVKRVTIGFNDNAIESVKQGYDFEKIKKELERAAAESEQSIDQQPSGEQPAPAAQGTVPQDNQ